MNIRLNVPYSEKDLAKSKGASLRVTQKLMNGLLACSLKEADIELPDDTHSQKQKN